MKTIYKAWAWVNTLAVLMGGCAHGATDRDRPAVIVPPATHSGRPARSIHAWYIIQGRIEDSNNGKD